MSEGRAGEAWELSSKNHYAVSPHPKLNNFFASYKLLSFGWVKQVERHIGVLSVHNIPGFDSIDVYRSALLISSISGGCRIATNSQRYKPLHIVAYQAAS